MSAILCQAVLMALVLVLDITFLKSLQIFMKTSYSDPALPINLMLILHIWHLLSGVHYIFHTQGSCAKTISLSLK